jgi:uncharacterized surface protein with fasciclin (FAS1) repeats
MLGDVSFKSLIIAYHAIPNVTYTASDLAAKGGDESQDRYVDTALARLLEAADVPPAAAAAAAGSGAAVEPLLVDEFDGKIFLKGIGSEAQVVTPDIPACNGVVHTIGTVLLPVDGDGELDEFQKQRVEAINKRAEEMKAEKEKERRRRRRRRR